MIELFFLSAGRLLSIAPDELITRWFHHSSFTGMFQSPSLFAAYTDGRNSSLEKKKVLRVFCAQS